MSKVNRPCVGFALFRLENSKSDAKLKTNVTRLKTALKYSYKDTVNVTSYTKFLLFYSFVHPRKPTSEDLIPINNDFSQTIKQPTP